MDILKLYQDFNIDYATEGHKHTREGWVNCACPFCSGTAGLHLGFNLERNYYVCWRCGWHGTITTLSMLLGVSEYEARIIYKDYGGTLFTSKKISKSNSGTEPYPIIGGELSKRHRKYLHARGYNTKELEREFKIRGTGPVAKLDKLDFKHRIVVPIFWQGQEVSFVARDITNKQQIRYLACPRKYEVEEHAKILYGHPKTFTNDSCILVEGVFDVWKLGIGAIATFGVKYTPEQLRWIRRFFKKVVIMYDGDEAGINQGKKLSAELGFFGVEVKRFILPLGVDPGSMNYEEAKNINNTLLI